MPGRIWAEVRPQKILAAQRCPTSAKPIQLLTWSAKKLLSSEHGSIPSAADETAAGLHDAIMCSLRLYKEYSRQEVHRLLSPRTKFVPQAGTWGLQGVVPISGKLGDYVFFVTYGKRQAGHTFNEGITRAGVLSWQSQPSQRLADRHVRNWIVHDPSKHTIYLFLRTHRSRRYAYLGKLAYISHDSNRECPVYFQWQILDWSLTDTRRASIGLEYHDAPGPALCPDPIPDPTQSTPPSVLTIVGDILLSDLPKALTVSTRLGNWLKRTSDGQDIPRLSIAEYVEGYPTIEKSLLRSWGIGTKTVNELSTLVFKVASSAKGAKTLAEVSHRLGIPLPAMYLLLQENFHTDPSRKQDVDASASPPTDPRSSISLFADQFRDWSFPECLESLPMSVRLSNSLRAFQETHGGTWSLAQVLRDYPSFVRLLQGLEHVGRKTVTECSALLCALVIRRLIQAGHDADRADEIGRLLCALDSSDNPATLPPSAPFNAHATPQDVIVRALSQLNERAKAILELRYGFGGPSRTLEEVGALYGLTRERIRQLEVKALKQLSLVKPEIRLALASHGEEAWRQLSGTAPLLSKADLDSAKKSLSPELTLAMDVGYAGVVGWLETCTSPTTNGWYIDRATKNTSVALREALQKAADGRALPLPISTLLPHAIDTSLAIAAARDAGFHVFAGYVCATKPGRRARRALRMHSLLATHWPNSVPVYELTKHYRAQYPDDQCSVRDALIVMEEGRHLFLHSLEDRWSTLRAGSPALNSTATDATSTEGDAEDDRPLGGSSEGDSIASVMEQLLEEHGPLRFSDLRERALKRMSKETSVASFGPVLLTSGLFIRAAPGLYALPKQLSCIQSGELLPDAMLATDQCRWFTQALRAGCKHGEYPAWNVHLEIALCKWAESGAVTPVLFESLLSVVQPIEWPIPKADRDYWCRTKTLKALYRLDQPVPQLSESPPRLEQLMIATQKVIADGSLNWMSMNRILGKRIDNSGSAAALAVLVAASVLKPAKHWQDSHHQGPGAEEFFSTLATARERDGRVEWESVVGQRELRACLQEDDRTHLGWVQAAELNTLLNSLAVEGNRVPPTDNPDDPSDILAELLASRRARQRAAAVRSLVDTITSTEEDGASHD